MEKLIELLNEYEKKRIEAVNAKWLPFNIKLSFRPYTEESLTNKAYRSCWLEICSKYYWFIKWLFDKDKIDWSKFHKYSFYKKDNKFIQYYDCESLLMALSIQDNPIDFLCSVLK